MIDEERLIAFIDAGKFRNADELCFSENDVVSLIRNFTAIYEMVEPKESEKTPEWIPLSKEKPDEGQNVHISVKMGYVEEGLYTKRYGFSCREGFICSNGKFMDIRETNAWMPKMKLKPYIGE